LSLEELGITDLDLIQDDSTQPIPSFSTNTDHKTTVLTKFVMDTALLEMEGNYFVFDRSANGISKDTVSTIDQLEFVSKELKQVV